jgi:hypothetical protein
MPSKYGFGNTRKKSPNRFGRSMIDLLGGYKSVSNSTSNSAENLASNAMKSGTQSNAAKTNASGWKATGVFSGKGGKANLARVSKVRSKRRNA